MIARDGGRFLFLSKSAFPPSMVVRSADNAGCNYLLMRARRGRGDYKKIM
jgi:hypothetical protein